MYAWEIFRKVSRLEPGNSLKFREESADNIKENLLVPEANTYVPDAKEALDDVAAKLIQKNNEMAAEASASLVPVRHKIRIEVR